MSPLKFSRRRMMALLGGPSAIVSGVAASGSEGASGAAQTPAESAAAVTPTDYRHPPGDLRRYGAIGGRWGNVPAVDDSAAWSIAVRTGLVIVPADMAFKIERVGTEYSGLIKIMGSGPTSQLYCDGQLLTVTRGSSSLISNVYLDSISTPLVFKRNVVTTISTTCATVGPMTFTASVAGCVAGTLSAAMPNGSHVFKFANGEIRSVMVAGGTAARWSAALSSTAGAITTTGVLTIEVANATGIAVGQQVFGKNIWNSTTVTAVSGTTITLADPCSFSGTRAAAQFYSITFNTGAAAIATLTSTKADGYRPPTVNDIDVYPSLTPGQIAQSQIGPIISMTGDHVVIEKIFGRFATLDLVNCNHSQVRDCDFKGGLASNGHGYGGIVFLNTGTVRCRGNSAIRNRVREAGNEGIYFMGCSEGIIADNFCYANGDSGIEFYQDGPGTDPIDTYYSGGGAVTSHGNVAIGNSQGGINYTGNYGSVSGFNTAMSTSVGDYCAWQQSGAAGFYGDGWAVTGLVCEYNAGPSMDVIASRGSFTNITCRENQYGNYGSFADLQIQGQGLMFNNVRVWHETRRSTRYSMAVNAAGGVAAGNFVGQNSVMMNVDLRDSVTPAAQCLQLAGNVETFNVRTNGAPYDQSVISYRSSLLAYAASITPDLSHGSVFSMNANNDAACMINAPINCPIGASFKIQIMNTSARPLGALSWSPAYRLSGPWVQPASGQNRSIEFLANTTATAFYEQSRTPNDVPN